MKIIILYLLFFLVGCHNEKPPIEDKPEQYTKKSEKAENLIYAPIETEEKYILISESPELDIGNEVYIDFSPLDDLGRVGQANAILGSETQASSDRGNISNIKPTGWNQRSYINIGSGGWLYNRSHLIGHQLGGEITDQKENLMTGTRQLNETMLEFENFIDQYITETDHLVRYRVTPVFEGVNLLASGIYMEAVSIDDEGISFVIYIPNIQEGVDINYATGESTGLQGPQELKNTELQDISEIDQDGNGIVTIQEAKDAGFQMPITSDHWLYQYMIDRDGDGKVGE